MEYDWHCGTQNFICGTGTITYTFTPRSDLGADGFQAVPTGFSLFVAISNNLNNPTDCTAGCTITTTCDNCLADAVFSATLDTKPANFIYRWVNNCCYAYWAFTTSAAVLDTAINGASSDQTVGRYPGFSTYPSPEPTIMVGQQVVLQEPSGATGQWYFDTIADTVGDYTLKDNVAPGGVQAAIPAVPSPSPVVSAVVTASPMSVYWITAGEKHATLIASYPNVNGPLVTDVYYNVATPVPNVTTATGTVNAEANYPDVANNGSFTCPGQLTALSLGNPCGVWGISWTYTTPSVPTYGSGLIGMAQLATESITYTDRNGNHNQQAPQGLDYKFPYENATSTSASWGAKDAPADELTSGTGPPCTSTTFSGNFNDYFMYQVNPPPSPAPVGAHVGSRLWVTLGTMNWGFSGTAVSKNGAAYVTSGKPRNPAPTFAQGSTLPTWGAIFVPLTSFC